MMNMHDGAKKLIIGTPWRNLPAGINKKGMGEKMGIKMFKTELFPYIDGLSLLGMRVNMIMDRVTVEMLPDGSGAEKEKFVLYFQGNKKGLVLNKTNVKRIIKAAGSDDTDDWKGKTICIFSEKVKAFGQIHDAVRVGPADPKAIQGSVNGKPKATKQEPAREVTDEEFNLSLFGDGNSPELIGELTQPAPVTTDLSYAE